MTRRFEVTIRDGPARIGRLRIDGTVETPAILSGGEIRSTGPIWNFPTVEDALKEGFELSKKTGKIFIGPHVAAPLHTEPPFEVAHIPTDGPSGAVVHPLARDRPPASDVYIIGAAGSLRNPRELLAAVIDIREKTPSDSALYAPALATPSNLALLTYLGVDLVEDRKSVV